MEERDPAVLRLHQRLMERDVTAPVELAEAYLDYLVRATRSALRPGDDEQLADDAATDALLSFSERPQQYDPLKMELKRFLRMAARRDLQNLRASETRHRVRQVSLDVELPAPGGNIDEQTSNTEDTSMRLERNVAALASDSDEEQVLELMMDGERRTEAYSEVLGISNRPPKEQRRVVKQMKDRLKKRIQRSGLGQRDDQTQ